MNARNLAVALLASGSLLAGASFAGSSAVAAITPDNNLYCDTPNDAIADIDLTTNSDTSSQTSSTSDVDLTIGGTTYNASNCYGAFSASPSTQAEEDDLNAIWGGGYTLLAKSDDGPISALNGVDFAVTSDQATSGTWTVSWTDNGNNLPFTINFAVLLNGATSAATHLLEGVGLPVMPTTGTGTFNIAFDNPGGNIADLSHLSLAGQIVPTTVPLPATFLLLGAGLAGLGLAARRRRRTDA